MLLQLAKKNQQKCHDDHQHTVLTVTISFHFPNFSRTPVSFSATSEQSVS